MPIVTTDTHSVPVPKPREPSWQVALRQAVRDPETLCRMLHLPDSLAEKARRAARTFPLRVPREYVERMQPQNPQDPLLRQVLPLEAELDEVAGYTPDPLEETTARFAPGVLQKYAHRALILATPTCAVHCRYCFRRHFDHGSAPRTASAWTPAWEKLKADRSIDELILSGGDPLLLNDTRLGELITRLEQIEHVQRLRIHTRLPVVIPQRITAELCGMLSRTRLAAVLVIHANHAAELDEHLRQALRKLLLSGTTLLNQAVLLHGVNDSLSAQLDLHRQLVNSQVMPYYLHQLDPVAGAAHFHVPPEVGEQLIADMRRHLPGYAIPRYVAEFPGEQQKRPLA